MMERLRNWWGRAGTGTKWTVGALAVVGVAALISDPPPRVPAAPTKTVVAPPTKPAASLPTDEYVAEGALAFAGHKCSKVIRAARAGPNLIATCSDGEIYIIGDYQGKMVAINCSAAERLVGVSCFRQ